MQAWFEASDEAIHTEKGSWELTASLLFPLVSRSPWHCFYTREGKGQAAGAKGQKYNVNRLTN